MCFKWSICNVLEYWVKQWWVIFWTSIDLDLWHHYDVERQQCELQAFLCDFFPIYPISHDYALDKKKALQIFNFLFDQ